MTKLRIPISDSDHSQGRKESPLTLLEYGDYECPYCGAAYPVIKRVQQELGNDLRFVFRNFPITQAHPHALPAAIAAEAAALQGEFWGMHDALYENQRRLDPDSLVDYATMLRLDLARFKRDVGLRSIEDRIADDQYGGMRSGVRGTPGLFINGIRYDGDWSYPTLRDALLEVRLSLAG
jgi:protein-disulfide isomerase